MYDFLLKKKVGLLTIILITGLSATPVKSQQYFDQIEAGLALQHDFSVIPFKPQTSVVPEVLFSGWIWQLTDHSHLRWSVYGNYRHEDLSLGTIYDSTNEAMDFWSVTAGGRLGFVSTFGYLPLEASIGLNRQFLEFTYREDTDPAIRQQANDILRVMGLPESDHATQLWAMEAGLSILRRLGNQLYIRPESRYYIPLDDDDYNLNRFYFKIGFGVFL